MVHRGALAALVLLLSVPGVLAQDAPPVLIERMDEGGLVADVGEPANATFRVLNLNPSNAVFVRVVWSDLEYWRAAADQDEFFVEPRAAQLVNVTFEPIDVPRGAAAFEVAFSVVDGASGRSARVVETVDVASGAPPRIFGVVPNPLEPPLDTAWGSFLLELLAWIGIAVATVLALHVVVRVLTARSGSLVSAGILTKLERPVLLFVLLLGLAQGMERLPSSSTMDFLRRVLVAIAVGVFGLYVVYRTLDALLFYYQKELSKRTTTEVDDILVPVIRKVGLVVIYAIGIVMSLRTLGWDPTIIFAGAGIAGLVIAFAAQDTFSNLFSGVFLMLDRPFVEGDDIQLESGDIARVVSVGLRTTRLHNYQTYEDVIVPNNQLATKRIINHTRPDRRYRINVDVGVAYGTDPREVERILHEVALANPRVAREPPFHPTIRFTRFGESSLDFTLRAVIPDFQMRNEIATELRFEIKRRFDEAGIEIPFPQRTVWIKEGGASVQR